MTTYLLKQPVKYSSTAWFGTILTLLLIALIGANWVDFSNFWIGFSFLIIVVPTLLTALWYAPLYVTASKDALTVRRPLKSLVIPRSEIESAVPCPPTMGAIRICGSGGFLGYWGWFRERDLGKYFAYYGKSSDCFLIKLKNGKKYMIGCANPQSVLDALK